MKSRQVFIMLIFLMSMTTLAGQTPDGFNYQAVARDAQGTILTNSSIAITFKIRSGSENGTVLWQELHNLTTDAIGSFSLIVGGLPSARTGGTVSNFSDIDWSADSHFLDVSVNGNDMGSTQLVSVPYAMHAGSVDMPLQNLEVVESPGTQEEDALFEVKREDGSTVFAVYNEGVRMYVDDTNKKGIKGGFAVGGYNATSKGYTNEYLRVTPDSVRVWINEVPEEKGVKGGFAVGGYNQQSKTTASSFMQLNPRNYFIGHEAGLNNANGKFNSFIGYQAGHENTSGSQNIFIGYTSGYSNTTGRLNTFVGNRTGYSNTTGFANVFIGDSSGYYNETGQWNVFVGEGTGIDNATGWSNVFLGDKAGRDNVEGSKNVFIGSIAGWKNIKGANNVFIGTAAGANNISGIDNNFMGKSAGRRNETGQANIFIGNEAGFKNVTGSDNIYIGAGSGYENDSTYSNIFIGNGSGHNVGYGGGNVYLGNRAGHDLETGHNNTIVGHESAHFKGSGQGNAFFGAYAAHESVSGDANTIIGSGAAHQADLGNSNTIIGTQAGSKMSGTNNVFIGKLAGANQVSDDKLVIENSERDSLSALIFGDFFNDMLTFNARTGIYTTTPRSDFQVSSNRAWAKLWVGELDSIAGFAEFCGGRSGTSNGGSLRLGTAADHDDANQFWQVSVNGENFQIGPQNSQNIFTITKDGIIEHRGAQLHADYVFDKNYQLESIEEHADFMWNNSHLPAVPNALTDDEGNDVVDLGARNKGVLEELEKAHIYIEQLNTALKSQQAMIDELKGEIDVLKAGK